MLHDAQPRGENLLFEGAQGALLDIDHGTYPYVTSSATASPARGRRRRRRPEHAALRARHHQGLHDARRRRPVPDRARRRDVGEHLSTRGKEFGAVTGRPRRCGWFDAALLQALGPDQRRLGPVHHQARRARRHARSCKICIGYELDGEHIDILPVGADEIARCEPVYETLPGWSESTVGVKRYDALPATRARYLKRIEAADRRADRHGLDRPRPRRRRSCCAIRTWPTDRSALDSRSDHDAC